MTRSLGEQVMAMMRQSDEMDPRQGIGVFTGLVIGLVMGATALSAAAQAGVTEKIGQTRVTTVPAPLPQAVPAGQGVRPSMAPRQSVAAPSAVESVTPPLLPKAPEVAHPVIPNTALTKPDVEVAPVAPSLAAHGLPLVAAPPSAGLGADKAAAGPKAAPPPPVKATAATVRPTKPRADAPRVKPAAGGVATATPKASPKASPKTTAKAAATAARKPADAEPRLRLEPKLRPEPRGSVKPPHQGAATKPKTATRASAHAPVHAPAPQKKRASISHQAKTAVRRNDGSQP